MKPPKILDKIVDVVLKYRPEAKKKTPRQRKISTKRLSDAESKKRDYRARSFLRSARGRSSWSVGGEAVELNVRVEIPPTDPFYIDWPRCFTAALLTRLRSCQNNL